MPVELHRSGLQRFEAPVRLLAERHCSKPVAGKLRYQDPHARNSGGGLERGYRTFVSLSPSPKLRR